MAENMDRINTRLRALFNLHLSRSASDLEKEEFWDYVNDPIYGGQMEQLVSELYEEAHEEAGLDISKQHLVLKNIFGPSKGVFRLWPKVAVAAAVILVLFGVGLFYFGHNNQLNTVKTVDIDKIQPGGNRAYLTLADGERIVLNDAKNGQLAEQAGVAISKTADGQLEYRVIEGKSAPGVFNTIETPRGGQYSVLLPDGSRVLLNAASRLKYPASFKGLALRKVELSGEGYFEISKDKNHPFVVKSSGQQVKVLGTHFNVSAYGDEPVVKTTLLEGRVDVNGRLLRPGQQAAITQGSVEVTQVNTDLVVAWKNGLFYFDRTPLELVMHQVSRWYDVKVVYKDQAIKQRTIGGTVTRYGNVSGILKAIATVGNVKFEIRGKTIFVDHIN